MAMFNSNLLVYQRVTQPDAPDLPIFSVTIYTRLGAIWAVASHSAEVSQLDPRHKNGGAQKHKTCEVASKLAQFSGFHSLFTSNLTIHSISSPTNLTWSGLVPSSHARHFQLVPLGDSVRVSSLGRWVEIPMGDRFPSYKPLVTHSSSTDILWKCQSKTKYKLI